MFSGSDSGFCFSLTPEGKGKKSTVIPKVVLC